MRWVLGLCLVGGVTYPAASIGMQQKTVAEGVFTREQAESGKKAYALYCEGCHAADLSGTNSGDSGAPPLRREGFMQGSDANALFTKIRQTMPFDAPASLKDTEYLEILAFVFEQNGFPPGPAPLTADAEALKAIRIVRAAPPRP